MRFFDDPGKALQQMEDELLEEDWDEEDVDEDGEDFPVLTRRDSRPTNYAVDFDCTVYDDEETDDAYYAEDYIADRKSRKKQRKIPSEPVRNTRKSSGKTCAGWVWTTTGRRRPKARGVPSTTGILTSSPRWGCCIPATVPAVSFTASTRRTCPTAPTSTPAPAGI